MNKTIFYLILLFFINSQASYGQYSQPNENIKKFIERLDTLPFKIIPSFDTIEWLIPCYGQYSEIVIHKNILYDTSYCKGILWCCGAVCEITFFEISEYHYEYMNVSEPNSLLYNVRKYKVIDRHYFLTEDQLQSKEWIIKPEYIIKILEENKIN